MLSQNGTTKAPLNGLICHSAGRKLRLTSLPSEESSSGEEEGFNVDEPIEDDELSDIEKSEENEPYEEDLSKDEPSKEELSEGDELSERNEPSEDDLSEKKKKMIHLRTL